MWKFLEDARDRAVAETVFDQHTADVYGWLDKMEPEALAEFMLQLKNAIDEQNEMAFWDFDLARKRWCLVLAHMALAQYMLRDDSPGEKHETLS